MTPPVTPEEPAPAPALEVFQQPTRVHWYLLADGLFDTAVAVVYFAALRGYYHDFLTAPGLPFDVLAFLDIVLAWDAVLAGLHLVTFVYYRHTRRRDVLRKVGWFSLVNHILLIPLGAVIELIAEMIFL